MKYIKTISLLLCLLLVLPSVGFCGVTYQITEQQIQALEQNLNKLESINKTLMLNSDESRVDLLKALSELKSLKEQLKLSLNETTAARQDLLKANQSLEQVNQSLRTLEQQEKKLKRNNVILQLVAGIAITYAAIK